MVDPTQASGWGSSYSHTLQAEDRICLHQNRIVPVHPGSALSGLDMGCPPVYVSLLLVNK